jgi:hypothetical protein
VADSHGAIVREFKSIFVMRQGFSNWQALELFAGGQCIACRQPGHGQQRPGQCCFQYLDGRMLDSFLQ